jgi:hydrogenase maturation protease
MAQIVVLGVGNILLTDEGAGIHASNSFHAKFGHLSNLRVVDGGTLSFTLAEHIDDADLLIVFDAARLEGPPGTVGAFVDKEMDRFLGSGRCSVHEVGLADLIGMAHLRGNLPRHRALVGVRPEAMGWGESMTDVVASAIPAMVDLAAELLAQWQPGFPGEPESGNARPSVALREAFAS